MKKPVVYLTIGLPASGKSTYASRMKDVVFLSADALRQELFRNEAIQYTQEFLKEHGYEPDGMTEWEKARKAAYFLWNYVARRGLEAVRNGSNILIDGTFVQPQTRLRMIRKFHPYSTLHGLFFVPDLNICLSRNQLRARKVDEKVIRKMAEQLVVPSLEEGFDVLDFLNPDGSLLQRLESPDYRKEQKE